MLQTLKQIC